MGALIDLFISFFKIGAFSFGGGYAMLPMIQNEVINVHKWITMAEYIDILAIAEMTPGPIAINSATFLGYKVAGIGGSALATLGVVLPSFIVMSLIFHFIVRFKSSPYVDWVMKGIRSVVLGLIAVAAFSVAMSTFVDIPSVLIAALLFYLVAFKNFNPIYAIVLAGAMGAILF
jgi:chromate transporter